MLGKIAINCTETISHQRPMGRSSDSVTVDARWSALAASEIKRVIDVGGFYAVGSTPDEFAAFLKQDYEYQGVNGGPWPQGQ